MVVIVISQAGKAFRAADSNKVVADKLAAEKVVYGNMTVTTNSAPIIAAITAAVGAYRSKHA